MIKYIFVVFISIIGINISFGQSVTENKDNYITLNLISPTYSYSPRWNLGYYRDLNEHFILGTEIGIGTYGTSINFAADANWIENKYLSIEISPELKYIINPKRKTKKFVSVELFYIYHKDRLKNRTYRNETDLNFYYYDSADYQRGKFGLNLNYGMIINLSNKFGLITKIGLGVKMRDVDFSNIINPILYNNYKERDALFTSANDFLTIEGFHTNANFNFEILFFYKFN